MNPYTVFNTQERKLIEKVENIENREYTKEEASKIQNKILEDIMSKSYKNGDMDKSRLEYSSILTKIENYI